MMQFSVRSARRPRLNILRPASHGYAPRADAGRALYRRRPLGPGLAGGRVWRDAVLPARINSFIKESGDVVKAERELLKR